MNDAARRHLDLGGGEAKISCAEEKKEEKIPDHSGKNKDMRGPLLLIIPNSSIEFKVLELSAL